MKKSNITKSIAATIVVLCLHSGISYSQFTQMFGQQILMTKYQTSAVGVGHFEQWNRPQAALHIDANILNSPFYGDFQRGEVFRTDGPSDRINTWTMFTGGEPGGPPIPVLEKGRLFVAPNSNNFTLQASLNNLQFNAGGNNPYMQILGSNGFVGVGDYNSFTPQSLMHLYEKGNTWFQITNTFTGNTANDGFRTGVINGTGNVHIMQQEFAPMQFFTSDGIHPISICERMRIFSTTYNNNPNITRVSINERGDFPFDNPVALLNLGFNPPIGGGGSRDWMDVGTYYSFQTDNMYVGLKNEEPSINDAVINWGNNPEPPLGPDNLRFIFTAPLLSGHPGDVPDGLEVARMTSDGRMGIGPTFTNANPPLRRLDVFDDTNPQFRLTQTLNSIFTDFRTTAIGDLLINPSNLDMKFGYVGIGLTEINPPTETIDVNGNTRIRELPLPANQNNSLDQVVVTDGSGVLRWRDAGTFAGMADADWYLANNIVPPSLITQDIYTRGSMGIGNFSAFLPQSSLHLHQAGNNFIYTQWTNGNTGNADANQGLRIGITGGGIAQIRQEEDRQIDIFTTNLLPSPPGPFPATRRMRIWHNNDNITRIGIGPNVTTPRTYLHIGDQIGFNNGGHRDWMDIGALYVSSSDNMYVGIRHYDNDQNEAIINWGNNPLPSANVDRLRFVFTAFGGANVPASEYDGLEIACMVSDGHQGRMGIGGDNNDLVIPGNPHNPYSLGDDPGNTVEINSPATSDIPGTSGLRFTDLSSASTPVIPPPTTNVLSVDDDGDVILIPAPTGAALGGICGTPGLIGLPAPGWEIPLNTNNFIFSGNQNGSAVNNVGIGLFDPSTGNTICTPQAKLDVLQASGDLGTIGINVENQDAPDFANSIPVIGIRSRVTNQSEACWNIAGWFSAPGSATCLGAVTSHYAIFVPEDGGVVSIGWNYPAALMFDIGTRIAINGQVIQTNPLIIVSDTLLKKDINTYTDGLNIIRQIEPITFKFNGLAGIDTTGGMQVGVDAQQLLNIAPYMVDTIKAKLDTSDIDYTDLYTYKPNCINFAAVNAIKELDIAVTELTSPPLPPVLIAPDSGATEVSTQLVEFKWHVSKNAGSYKLFISTTPDTSGIIESVTTSDTIVRIGGLGKIGTILFDCGTTYYWAVIAINSYGWSDQSEIWSFTTETAPAPPEPPLLALPSNGDTIWKMIVPFFHWHPSTDAYYYEVSISTTPDETGLVQTFVTNDTAVGGGGFVGNTTYYWWVIACNYCGFCSDKSEIWNFTYFSLLPIRSMSEASLSDADLKTNVTPLTEALTTVQQLNGVYFDWNTAQYPYIDFEQGSQIGLIAQDVQPVIPEVVKTDALGFNYIEYNRLVPVLIEAIKELKEEYDSLKNENNLVNSRLDAIEDCVNNLPPGLCGGSTKNYHNDSDNNNILENKQDLVGAKLFQNQPNPFDVETEINYYLPENVTQAEMFIFDMQGKQIKRYELTTFNGNGKIIINGGELSPGMFFYSLIANGKEVGTKRMIITE